MPSIISDIADAFGEIKKNLGAMTQAPDKIMNAGKTAGSEARFFSRPIDSVARRAKQSILYFPVIGSESLSSETLAIIAKATQVRAAEYVRLMISNMDPVEAADYGKTAVVAALRGATLKDAFIANEDVDAASEMLRKRLSQLVEHAFIEDGLREPLSEAPGILNSSNVKHSSKSVGKGWDRFPSDDEKAEAISKMWNSGNRIQQDEARKAATAWLRSPYWNNVPETLRKAGLEDLLDDLNVDPSERKRSGPAFQSAPDAHTLRDAAVKAASLLNNGTQPGRQEAKKIVSEIMRKYDLNDGMLYTFLTAHGLNKLADEIDAEGAPKMVPSPEAEEAARRDKRIAEAQALAKKGTAQGREAATQIIQDLMSTGDGSIGKLKTDPATAKIVAMLEKLPGGVVRDGSYNVTATANRADVARNIDFDKLNAFQPILLDLTIRYKTPAGEPLPITDRIALGVKGVAHPIPSLDLVTGLGTALQRDSLVLQFFRMTSGETSFVKDFVLNLKVAQMRASAKTTTGAKVLETLRRQAEWNDRRSNWLIASIAKRGFVPPTTTMVVTSDEVEKIKSLYGVDFTKPSAVRELMKSHNLMGFIIVDEAIGLVRVFEDGDDDFDRLPISTLKSQGKEGSLKDILTILARS